MKHKSLKLSDFNALENLYNNIWLSIADKSGLRNTRNLIIGHWNCNHLLRTFIGQCMRETYKL